MKVMDASRDLASIERFLPLFIERAALQSSEIAANRERKRKESSMNPARVQHGSLIPHAFELWFGHLGRLDRMNAAVTMTLDDLTMEEARGLAIFRQARQQFWQSHTACPQCNSVNPRHSSFCSGCGADFRSNRD
jgi:hypothetical protein